MLYNINLNRVVRARTVRFDKMKIIIKTINLIFFFEDESFNFAYTSVKGGCVVW